MSQTDSMAGASMSLTDIEVGGETAVGRRWFDAGHRNRDPNQEVISHWRERSEMSFQRGAPLLNMHPSDGRRSPPEKICSICSNTHRHTHHLVRYGLVEKKKVVSLQFQPHRPTASTSERPCAAPGERKQQRGETVTESLGSD